MWQITIFTQAPRLPRLLGAYGIPIFFLGDSGIEPAIAFYWVVAAALVVNALYPPLPTLPVGFEARDPVAELWRRRRQVNERELTRLERAVGEPIVPLPLLPIAEGKRLVGALAAELGAFR